MTKKDYTLIVKALQDGFNRTEIDAPMTAYQKTAIIVEMAEALKSYNAKFDNDKFQKAFSDIWQIGS